MSDSEPKIVNYTLDELVGEVLKIMMEKNMLDHYDAYGGALFALDLRDVLEEVYARKGVKFKATRS